MARSYRPIKVPRRRPDTPDLRPLGLFLPGKHIPIVDKERIRREQPDYLIILSWHFLEPIAKRLREEGLKSKLITPLPEFRILDA